jgi:hypothetical protein
MKSSFTIISLLKFVFIEIASQSFTLWSVTVNAVNDLNLESVGVYENHADVGYCSFTLAHDFN